MDYTLNIVSKWCFSLYLNIRGLRKGPGQFFMGVLESLGKVLDFFWSVKEWEPCLSSVIVVVFIVFVAVVDFSVLIDSIEQVIRQSN